MKTIYKASLTFILIFFGLTGVSQNLYIEQLSIGEGLSQSVVLDIHVDVYGFVWAATEHGLNRYDGYSFTVYRHDPHDSTSIKANYVSRIFEDLDGNIWVSTARGGLCRYDRATDGFQYFQSDFQDQDKLNNSVQSFLSTKDGRLWIGTSQGLNLLDAEANNWEFIPTRGTGLDGPVFKIIEDSNGQIWASSKMGLFKYDEQSKKLILASYKRNGKTKPFKSIFARTYLDQNGRLWVGTRELGIFKYDLCQDQFIHENMEGKFHNIPERVAGIQELPNGTLTASFRGGEIKQYDPLAREFKDYESLNSFPETLWFSFADSLGSIWALGLEGNLFYKPPQTDTVQQVFLLPKENQEKPLQILSLSLHKNGDVWLGTRGEGMFRLSLLRHEFDHFSSFNSRIKDRLGRTVTAMVEDYKGHIWIGTISGLHEFIPESKSFKTYFFKRDGLSDPNIQAILEDRKKQLWLATRTGIEIWDENRNRIKYFPIGKQTPGSISSDIVRQIYEDRTGKIWISTANGIYNWNPITESFKRYFRESKKGEQTFLSNGFRCVYQDKEGTYWIGNVLGGLSAVRHFGTDSMRFTHYPYELDNSSTNIMTINDIVENSEGEILVGTYSRGLLKVEKETQKLVRVLDTDGPPIPHVSGILEDDLGGIWVSSFAGILRYDGKTKEIRRFDISDGLQSNEFNIGGKCKTKSGKLFFGGVNGMNCFMGREIMPAHKPIPPIFTRFRKSGKDLPLPWPISEVGEVELSYSDRFFSIEFTSLAFPTELNQYAYRLKGLDDSWIHCGNQRSATYAHIPPGKYVFQVKTANREGGWSGEETTLKLVIHPPYWAETWFHAMMISLIIGTLLLIHHLRIRAKFRKIREIDGIRQKAAADFHDELGHKLTRISLLSEVLYRKVSPDLEEPRSYMIKIRENAQELYHTMRDFLWAMDPSKDSGYELAILLKDFGDELFDKTPVDFRMNGIDERLKNFRLNMDWKRHLILIFKEAMHNTLKYANAKNVTLNIHLKSSTLILELIDDGDGFLVQSESDGYGLRNMRNRAADLEANLIIESMPGMGTCVRFEGDPEMAR